MIEATFLEEIDKDNSNLIKALQTVQKNEGYISDDRLVEVAEYFSIPVVEVEGVVSFYAQFRRIKPGKFIISICDGTACHIKGSILVKNWITEKIGVENGETDEEGIFSLETVACLGCCSLAPVIAVNGKVHGNLTRRKVQRVLQQYRKETESD